MNQGDTEGWGLPNGSRKFHYSTADGMSLCHRYGFYAAYKEQEYDDHPQNCAACKKLKLKRKEDVGVVPLE